MNKIEITVPEGFEIDQSKSDLSKGIIEFKPIPEKPPTLNYSDIARKLFSHMSSYHTDSDGFVSMACNIDDVNCTDPNLAESKKQLECLMTFNKLRNVATYLNKEHDVSYPNERYSIGFNIENNEFVFTPLVRCQYSEVYFYSVEAAKQAIEILGEEEVKKALFLY